MNDLALDPALLARVGDLELIARTIVEGLRTGPHRSPFHGYSAEFSQYRHYRPGDELKYVDWKLLARTDRLYTKQFRETTDLSATIVLDCSGSMGFAGAESADGAAHGTKSGADRAASSAGAPTTKLRYATLVAAALAHLIVRQGDAIGLFAFHEPTPAYLPPRGGGHHRRRLLATLAGLEARGTGTPDLAVRRATETLKRRGMICVFSDFYERETETLAELRKAVRMGHDVAVFHTVTRSELEFPYRDDTEFRDLESAQTLVTNAAGIKRAYREAFSAFVERWRSHTRAEGMDYTLLVNDAPLDDALRGFLMRRGTSR
jgi:uncharacterized protein (DUF58 family)